MEFLVKNYNKAPNNTWEIIYYKNQDEFDNIKSVRTDSGKFNYLVNIYVDDKNS